MKRFIRPLALLAMLTMLLTGCVNMEFVPSYANRPPVNNQEYEDGNTTPEEPYSNLILERYDAYTSDLHEKLGLYKECYLLDYNYHLVTSEEEYFGTGAFNVYFQEYILDHAMSYKIYDVNMAFYLYQNDDASIELIVDQNGRIRKFTDNTIDIAECNRSPLTEDEYALAAGYIIESLTESSDYTLESIATHVNEQGLATKTIHAMRYIDGYATKDDIFITTTENTQILQIETGISYGMFDEGSEFPFSLIDVENLMKEKADQIFYYGYDNLAADPIYFMTLNGKKALWLEIRAIVYSENVQGHEFSDVWIVSFGS